MNAQLRHVDIPIDGQEHEGLGLGEDGATSQAFALQTSNPDERIVSIETLSTGGQRSISYIRVWIVKQ